MGSRRTAGATTHCANSWSLRAGLGRNGCFLFSQRAPCPETATSNARTYHLAATIPRAAWNNSHSARSDATFSRHCMHFFARIP